MSAGTAILHEALGKVKAHSVVSLAPPESMTLALNTLNSMLQTWLSRGIDMGTMPLNAHADELGEPMDARNGIVNNLAIAVAPDFSYTPSRELMLAASTGLDEITKQYGSVTIPRRKVSSTMPLGAGYSKGPRRKVFAGTDTTIDA